MESAVDQLEFVTVEGLLAYGEMLARRSAGEGITFPPLSTSSVDRPQRTREAMEKIRAFVQGAQEGFPGAEEYRTTRRALIEEGCRGDELVFFAAWNVLLAAGELAPLLRMPIRSVQKPTHRRPVAIVPRSASHVRNTRRSSRARARRHSPSSWRASGAPSAACCRTSRWKC